MDVDGELTIGGIAKSITLQIAHFGARTRNGILPEMRVSDAERRNETSSPIISRRLWRTAFRAKT
jgi:hypothetical protein